MTLWSRIRSLLRATVRRSQMEREMDAEVRFHIEALAEDLMRSGVPREEAVRKARIEFGGVERVKEECREARGFKFIEDLLYDLRFTARAFRKSAGFTSVAIITLALGIGTNTAMFSLVNSVLFRPLPYHEPQQLVWVSDFVPRHQSAEVIESDYYAWLAQNHVFTDVAAYDSGDTMTLTNSGEPARLRAAYITYNFLDVLGVAPKLGRPFHEDEDRPGAPHVVLLSDQLWRTRFSAAPSILGRSVVLNGDLYSIVGILPANFEFLDNFPAEVITPIALENHEITMQRGMRIVNVVARLRPGVTTTAAAADIDTINQRLFAAYPPAFANMFRGARAEVIPVRERLLGKSRPALVVLFGAVAFVLLIACANIASLQLARAISREKEIAIRTALGAGRTRVIRQLLAENAALAFAGGVCGLLLASVLIRALVQLSPADVPHLALARLDLRALLFTLGVTCLAALLSGLAPAFAALRPEPVDSLKEAGSQPRATRLGRRPQRALVVAELAAAVVLLTGAALLIESFHRLASVQPGFDANDVFTARISLPPNLYVSDSQRVAFYQQLVERTSSLPGVTSASVSSVLPLQGSNDSTSVELEGHPPELPGQAPLADLAWVSSGYYQALRIPLLRGALFDPRNPYSNASLLVVNQAFARRFFPDQDPIGHRVLLGKSEYWTITGVVGDTKQAGLAAPVGPGAFISISKQAVAEMTLILRTNTSPESLLPTVRSIVGGLDKNLPLYGILTMQDLLRGQTASQRFSSLLLSAFAALAVLLASLGIYGVTAYTVSQRTREFGLRTALGAQPKNIFALVLKQAAVLAFFGVSLGVIASLASGKLIASMLYQLQPTDPATFLTVSAVLLVIVLAACYLPARRASRVDPMVALRYE